MLLNLIPLKISTFHDYNNCQIHTSVNCQITLIKEVHTASKTVCTFSMILSDNNWDNWTFKDYNTECLKVKADSPLNILETYNF